MDVQKDASHTLHRPYDEYNCTGKADIMRRKTRYFEHLIRRDSIERRLVTGKIDGKRGRGRHRRTWITDITEWTGRSLAQSVRDATKRSYWHCLTANLQDAAATRR